MHTDKLLVGKHITHIVVNPNMIIQATIFSIGNNRIRNT